MIRLILFCLLYDIVARYWLNLYSWLRVSWQWYVPSLLAISWKITNIRWLFRWYLRNILLELGLFRFIYLFILVFTPSCCAMQTADLTAYTLPLHRVYQIFIWNTIFEKGSPVDSIGSSRLSHTSLIYAREAGNINSNRFVPTRGRAESSLSLSHSLFHPLSLFLSVAYRAGPLEIAASATCLANALEINLRQEREREKESVGEKGRVAGPYVQLRESVWWLTSTTMSIMKEGLDFSDLFMCAYHNNTKSQKREYYLAELTQRHIRCCYIRMSKKFLGNRFLWTI